jgi:hypothetical protein
VPYWDWAVTPALPNVVTTPSISINTPDGFQEMDNPLYNYTFQADAAGNGFPSGHPVRPLSCDEDLKLVKPRRSID